eukprot:1146276-Pelagomonas_calceolata.AAC.2
MAKAKLPLEAGTASCVILLISRGGTAEEPGAPEDLRQQVADFLDEPSSNYDKRAGVHSCSSSQAQEEWKKTSAVFRGTSGVPHRANHKTCCVLNVLGVNRQCPECLDAVALTALVI